jgi:hypothetical protein
VTKLLLRDPRFLAASGSEKWFPHAVGEAGEIVDAFRRFVAALQNRPAEWHDPHWPSQVDLVGIGELEYRAVARMEELPTAMWAVDEHLL